MAKISKYYKLEKEFLGLTVYMKKGCFGYVFQVYDHKSNVGTGTHSNKFRAYRKAVHDMLNSEHYSI